MDEWGTLLEQHGAYYEGWKRAKLAEIERKMGAMTDLETIARGIAENHVGTKDNGGPCLAGSKVAEVRDLTVEILAALNAAYADGQREMRARVSDMLNCSGSFKLARDIATLPVREARQ